MVSEFAIDKTKTFDIYDGVLYNPFQKNKIYLNQAGAKIEVPQWFWKVVINRNKGVVPGLAGRNVEEEMIFFVYNDPYSSPADTFCVQNKNNNNMNNCENYSWHFDDDVVRGKTHCCLHKDLKRGTLPKEVMDAFGSNMNGLYYLDKRPRNG